MIDKLDAEFQFGQRALDLRAYRQQLLSSNIANADTPGYKARDVDFASTLKTALGQGAQGAGATGTAGTAGSALPAGAAPQLQLVTTSPGQLSGAQPSAGDADAALYGTPLYRNPTQASLDNNTVDLDTERVNFADNAMHYETGLTVLTTQIKTMLAALSDGT
jgi:flagellar basal-body rod protein FlgB